MDASECVVTPVDSATFDDLVIGASNGVACAAALSVAEAPARSSNPLFVHGSSGLGKTHLLHAIANYSRRNNPALHVQYMSSEMFMIELVDAIRNNGGLAVKRRYRCYEILLVDDLQFMKKMHELQIELSHIVNSACEAGRQIVLASSRPPDDTPVLHELLACLPSYQVVSIAPLDADAKVALLGRELAAVGVRLGDAYVAELVPSLPADPRAIIAALRELAFWSQLWQEPIGASLVRWVVRRRAALVA